MPVEDWLPEPIAEHRYEVSVPLEPERALAHALSTPVAPDRVVRTLFRLRGLSAKGTIESFGQTPPFVLLSRTRTEWVAGIGAASWRPRGGPVQLRDASEWPGWDKPGTIRAAMTLRAQGGDGGWSRLITETAVQPTGASSERAFRAYWLVVGPFSQLIRKRWLRAMAERCRAVGAR